MIGYALRGYTKLLDAPVGGVASVTSPGRAWFTSRFVSERGNMSSRSVTVMKALRSPWNQNRVPPFSEISS